jgi:phage terminase small subunit
MKLENHEGYSDLRLKTRKWLKKINKDYELESHHLRLLIMAGAAWDRHLEARQTLEAEGAYIYDRFSQRKIHPGVAVEKESMLTFSKLLRETGLDLVPEDSRPLTRPGGY